MLGYFTPAARNSLPSRRRDRLELERIAGHGVARARKGSECVEAERRGAGGVVAQRAGRRTSDGERLTVVLHEQAGAGHGNGWPHRIERVVARREVHVREPLAVSPIA